MLNRYAQRPNRTIIYASIAQERAWGCEYPVGDPWGGPVFGEKNKGGVFSQTYWEKGGIVNSVASLVTNPIGYTNDRLKEFDKTVIQPIGNGLEKAGQAIANDPENFALMLAAAATQQWYIVAAMAMVISAGKGNDWDKVLTDGAIAGATSFVAVEGSNMLMETMKVTANGATSYAIAGMEISKTTASVIANGASYAASGAVTAAATGKSVGEAALRGAITGGFVSAVQGVDIMKDFSAAIDGVAAKGVGSAITNAISGAAGSALSGIVTGKDTTTQIGMALVGGAVNGLASAIQISGDFFSSNAAEALDLQYDDYGPSNDTRSVAEYLTEKLGPVGAGFVTNTVTSVLTSTFTKGDPSTFLAQQIIGNLTQTVKNAFDPRFKTQYVDPLTKYMDDAKSSATKYNDFANRQNALGEDINGNVTSYNNRVSAVNSIIDQRTALANQYNSYTSANSSQAQVDATYAQIQSLDNQIRNEVNSLNSFYQTGIIDKQAQYDALKVQTTEAQNAYNGYVAALGDASVPLTKYLNDTAKQMSIDTAKTIDPDFNPEEYRTINGLSSTDDVGAHYISVGKDQGLYTNFEASKGAQEALEFKAMDAFARTMGYSGGAISLPASVYNDSLDKMRSFYGNNLKAWESFTVDSFTQQIKLPPTAIMPMWDSQTKELTVAKVIFNEQTGQDQLVNITTKLPEGKAAATASQILSGQADMVRGNDGNFYWTVGNDQSSAMVYDASTGQIVKAVMSPSLESAPVGATNVSYNEDGSVAGYTGSDGIYRTTITGVMDSNPADADVVVTATRVGTPIEEADPLVQMYTYADVPDGIAANFNIKGTVQAAKDVVDYMQKDATDVNKLKIATIVKSAGSVMQDVGTVLGDLSVTIGLSKTNNSTLANLGKQLEGLADAKTPEQYKTAMEDIKAMRNAAKGSDIVGVNAAIAQKYPDLVGVSVFGGELFEELIQNGVGKAAMVAGGALAATLGAPALIAGAIGAGVGYGVSMAMDFSESYRGAKEEMYTRMYDIYKEKGYSDAQAAQMAEGAATKAGVMNGLITMVVNGATPGDLNKVLFGGKANPAQEAITNYFVDKLQSAGKVALAEFGEGLVEGTLQGMYNETLVYSVDPSKADYAKGMADSAMLESIIGAPVSVGAYAVDNSFDIAQKTFTLANQQFDDAITSGSIHTIGELGTVFKSWGIPASVSMEMVPTIVNDNPALLAAYSTPAELTTALTNSFGFDANQAADIANIKFNQQITTADEAKTTLLNAGLQNVTDKDIANAGVVGVTAADQATKIANYANQQMVSEAEVRAAAAQENYNITQEELSKLVGRGVQADVIAKFVAEIDPKAVTTAEATQYFKDQGYDVATAKEIAQFVKSAPETEVQNAVAAYVAPHQVTRAEAIQFYKDLNYTPTEQEITNFIKQGATIDQEAVKADLGAYVDPRYVDPLEVKAKLAELGLTAPATEADISRLTGQYAETDLTGKVKEALPVIGANAAYAATQTAAKQLSDQITANENAGIARDQAISGAVDKVAADLGTTRADLLTQIGLTEETLQAKIAGSETALTNKITGTEAALTGKIGQVSQEVQAVSDLLGKPASQVTQADLDYIKSITSGAVTTGQNLAYDANKDGKIDAADQTLIEQQLAFQQNQNIKQQTDPNTGLSTWVDKTTGATVEPPNLQGSQWAPTGIYAALEQQKAQAAATAKAQAATAKTAQQKNQFGQIMSMLMQAPDAAGQQVTVKTPDPAKIGYFYDWSSIFATPSQAQMMPSPYGAMNITAPQQRQAANQPQLKMASGFAAGGIVGNDIQVGDGGSIDDLLNYLKGNSG